MTCTFKMNFWLCLYRRLSLLSSGLNKGQLRPNRVGHERGTMYDSCLVPVPKGAEFESLAKLEQKAIDI